MNAFTYPDTIYKPQTAVDLTSAAERKRLSGPGLKAFFKFIELSNVRDVDAMELLGGVSNGPYYAMKKNPDRKILDVDKLQRISLLIGIFKALHILHGRPLSDQWLGLKNTNPVFANKTPLEYMRRGGLPAMLTVRRLLDARRGGGR